MNRRNFLKKYSVIIVGITAMPNLLIAENKKSRKFKLLYNFDIKYEDKNFSAKLWNPLPLQSSYQKVKTFVFHGNYDNYNINTKNIYDAKILYASWQKSEKKKHLKIEMEIETFERIVPLKTIENASKQNLSIPKEVQLYLEPTSHIPTDGKVALKSGELTTGIKDRFQKVQAIYNWVTEVTFRDPSVIGCGVGDAGKMMDSGYFGGKCTDVSSLFVAFLRAAGIPAREVFGIRLGKSSFSDALGKSDKNGFADISSWQHCRVEYYIPGAGWIPSDPADVTKLELVEGLKYSDKRVQTLKNKYLHSWEMNWIGFNYGRDFVLYPEPEQFPINMLGYPYGEIEDEVLNYYSPKSFSYQITSQELGL
ncbi:MAG: twin-arginine translocation pathway signal protein [Sulfurovum sp.]|nr:MAG: twin-arginine translocation pathway signal protein [Sulfurovum sp.]